MSDKDSVNIDWLHQTIIKHILPEKGYVVTRSGFDPLFTFNRHRAYYHCKRSSSDHISIEYRPLSPVEKAAALIFDHEDALRNKIRSGRINPLDLCESDVLLKYKCIDNCCLPAEDSKVEDDDY